MKVLSPEQLGRVAELFDTIDLTPEQITFVHALHHIHIHPLHDLSRTSAKEQRAHVMREVEQWSRRCTRNRVESARLRMFGQLAIDILACMSDDEVTSCMHEYEYRVEEMYGALEPPVDIQIQIRKMKPEDKAA